MSTYADAIRYWREPFEAMLRDRKPYRQPANFHASAPPITFADPRLLESDEYLQFLDVYLDVQAKHDLEQPQAQYPEFCFTARRLELAGAFPHVQVRDAALGRIMHDRGGQSLRSAGDGRLQSRHVHERRHLRADPHLPRAQLKRAGS